MQTFSILQTLDTVNTIIIQNSQIEELKGFGLQTIGDLIVSNNPYLNSIDLQPYNVTGTLRIGINGRSTIVSMPNLQYAQVVLFANSSNITIPSLTQVDGGLASWDNYMADFRGAPLLQSVNGGFNLSNNRLMTSIELPYLQKVADGFTVYNNTNLTTLDGLYGLTTNSRDAVFDGNVT